MDPDLIHQAKIFIIDDEMTNVRLLGRFLSTAGYENVAMTTDPRRAVSMFADDDPDLVLLDLHMPHPDGFETLTALREITAPNAFLPIVVLTADCTSDAKRRALSMGATDFLSKPFDDVEVLLRIESVLRTRFLHRQLQNEKALLEERVRERTRLLERTVAELKCANSPLFSSNL
jgi:putative two-component system response regulator